MLGGSSMINTRSQSLDEDHMSRAIFFDSYIRILYNISFTRTIRLFRDRIAALYFNRTVIAQINISRFTVGKLRFF